MSTSALNNMLKAGSASTLSDVFKQKKEEMVDLEQKRLKIQTNKVNKQFEELESAEKTNESFKSLQVGFYDENYFTQLAESNSEYFLNAKNAPKFLANDDLAKGIPYFARNLIFLGAVSGDGKSTTTANLALHTIAQGKSILVITNEEVVADCYNRVTCLIKKWAYTDHSKFTTDQIKEFNEMTPKLAQRMVVVDDSYRGLNGVTTTYEGFVSLMESLLVNPIKFNAIVIDYFQNISMSVSNPSMEEWKVLDKVAQYLDGFRKRYGAPIVLLGQLKPIGNADTPAPFKDRIERCKSIYNKATCAVEMKADRQHSITNFLIYKSRFNAAVGSAVKVGFDKGKYVPFTSDFASKKLLEIEQKKQNELLSKVMG